MKKIRKHPESYKALWVLSSFHRYSDYKHVTPYRNNSGVFVCVRFGRPQYIVYNLNFEKMYTRCV